MKFSTYINSHAEPNGVRIDFEQDVEVEYDPPLREPQYSRKLEVTSVIDPAHPKAELLHTLSDEDIERLEEEAYENWEDVRPGGNRDQAAAEDERDARRDAREVRRG